MWAVLILSDSHLGQTLPWTKICLDNCYLDKSLLGQWLICYNYVLYSFLHWIIFAFLLTSFIVIKDQHHKCLSTYVNYQFWNVFFRFSTSFLVGVKNSFPQGNSFVHTCIIREGLKKIGRIFHKGGAARLDFPLKKPPETWA